MLAPVAKRPSLLNRLENESAVGVFDNTNPYKMNKAYKLLGTKVSSSVKEVVYSLTDSQLLLGITLFIILFNRQSQFKGKGKIELKKIVRLIKKQLAISRCESNDRYLDIVFQGSRLVAMAEKEVKLWLVNKGLYEDDTFNLLVCPMEILKTLNFKYRQFMEVFEISNELIDGIDVLCTGSKSSIKYSSILFGSALGRNIGNVLIDMRSDKLSGVDIRKRRTDSSEIINLD